MKAVS
jgi:organic hydroperoxide reductase OsmC/OhrA